MEVYPVQGEIISQTQGENPNIQQCIALPVSDLLSCKFNLFNQLNFPIEAFRQWFILILSISMISYFIYCQVVLRKTQRAFTFEFLILFIETIKLILLLLHEFLLINMVMLLVIMILQSQIRAIVGANFIKKYFEMTNQQFKLRQFYFIYYGIIVSLNIAILIVSVLPSTKMTCDDSPFTYQWFVVCGIDLGQSVLILFCGHYLMKLIKAKQSDEQKRMADLQLLDDDKQYHSLNQQIKIMSLFYLIFSVLDIALIVVANLVAKKGEMFLCLHEWYLLPRNDGGSIYLLADALLCYLFSGIILHIFYKIPMNHGLLIRHILRQDGSADHISLKMTYLMKQDDDNATRDLMKSGEYKRGDDGDGGRRNTDQYVDQIIKQLGNGDEDPMPYINGSGMNARRVSQDVKNTYKGLKAQDSLPGSPAQLQRRISRAQSMNRAFGRSPPATSGLQARSPVAQHQIMVEQASNYSRHDSLIDDPTTVNILGGVQVESHNILIKSVNSNRLSNSRLSNGGASRKVRQAFSPSRNGEDARRSIELKNERAYSESLNDSDDAVIRPNTQIGLKIEDANNLDRIFFEETGTKRQLSHLSPGRYTKKETM